jgi:hypothetical protein
MKDFRVSQYTVCRFTAVVIVSYHTTTSYPLPRLIELCGQIPPFCFDMDADPLALADATLFPFWSPPRILPVRSLCKKIDRPHIVCIW